jgi:glyoxylase-like metal-dependent hydrolase (beta-lactamase superfamily II)
MLNSFGKGRSTMHEFRKLSEGVYAFLQPALIWYSSAGVIVGDKDVIVIDSLTNQAMTRSLLEEISKVTAKPVRILINTHSHADHVYTNLLFPSATVLTSGPGREKTREFMQHQILHDETFTKLFPDVDFTGGRYTLQDMTFSGTVFLYRNEREIRVIELGPGHSESDVIVHMPGEKIVFCGDVFMNGLPPMPSEGYITRTIDNLRMLEELQAEIYVAGHGNPGNLKEITEHRILLESLARQSRACFDHGLSYDEAIETFCNGPLPIEFVRPSVLSGYCEWGGKMPVSRNPDDTNHMQVIRGVADKARCKLQNAKCKM